MNMPGGRKQLLLWIAAALAATAGLATILIREHPQQARRAPYVVGDARRGSDLFFGKKQCSICHAVGGSGGRIAPDLSATRPGAPAMGWLATAMWNHAPGMFRRIRGSQAYPQLDSQEMADILAFLYRAANSDPAGDLSKGAGVFQQKGCARCHSVRSAGGNSAPELSAVAAGGANQWMSAMWNHAHSMIGPVTSTLGRWPQFAGNEMNDLLAYVAGGAKIERTETAGKPERGWDVFQKRCIQCHSVRGNGGKVGPELGPERELPLSATQFASVLWNHAPAMLRLGNETGAALTLEKNEMADLIAFVASLRYVEPPGSPFVGERVFNTRGCSRCHGAAAEGTQLGPAIRGRGDAFTAVSLTTSLWKHGPKMVDRAEELGIPWPVLQANDLGDLVSFLNAGGEHQ